MSEKKESKEKCLFCKTKTVGFHLHNCKRAIQEYYGCSTCDDWCTTCRPNWQNNDKKE